MDSAITDILQHGLTPNSLWVLATGAVVFFIGMSVKRYITKYRQYLDVKSNLSSGEGKVLRYPTSTGYEDYVLQKVTRKKVYLQHVNLDEFGAVSETLVKEVDVSEFDTSTKTFVLDAKANAKKG